MRKLLWLLCIILPSMVWAARPLNNETVRYRIFYKWGLINKQAGSAWVTLRDEGKTYRSQLVAHSAKWADKFYTVRDTLNGTMEHHNYKPLFYEKIAHEGNDDKHDTVRFSYGAGGLVTGHCSRTEFKNGVLKKDYTQTMTATGTVVDMLSSYYYVRTLPFESWVAGHSEAATIFSGKEKEKLTFKYKGIENVDVNGHLYQCYHVTFVFTGKNGTKSSENMDAWITADSRRIAIKLSGKLPIGHVHCEAIVN